MKTVQHHQNSEDSDDSKSPATKKRATNGAKAGNAKKAKITEEVRLVEDEVIKAEDNAVDT
jgi:hypothetical protein